MTIVFRLKYHTVPGQSLWLKLATAARDGSGRREQLLPMQWLNDRQWEITIEDHADGPRQYQYSYQFRQDENGVELDEWNGPRSVTTDPAVAACYLLEDTWCSAGTVDYAYETKARVSALPPRRVFAPPRVAAGANHTFQLRMAGVPDGMAPCLLGGTGELGEWQLARAVPLRESSANVWQTSVHLPHDAHVEYKYGLFDLGAGCAVSLEEGSNRFVEARSLGARQWTMVRDEGYGRAPAEHYRAAGVAIPVFSLRSDAGMGVGEFADLKGLADWAAGVGLKLIQILPINDTTATHDWGDSYPYSAISVFALHPLYLRIDDLRYPMPDDFTADLHAAREWLNAFDHLDYVEVMKAKTALTRRVFEVHGKSITASAEFGEFLADQRDWLVPYAVFCVLRDRFGTADFHSWGEWADYAGGRVAAMADPTHPEWAAVAYHLWLQHELDRQLAAAVSHLRQRGIALKGDLPIGIDRQSVDAWSSPHGFNMNAQAGAPPDAFAVKGQNWGFPTCNWEAMRHDGYAWWRARFARLSHYFDAYRIDHILGFFRIWQIPREQVEGIMGRFDPALPVHIDEIRGRGIPFDFTRYCRPYIRQHFLWERFGDTAREALDSYLDDSGHGIYQLRDGVATQRAIVAHFAGLTTDDPVAQKRLDRLRDGLLDCASDVMFFEVPGTDGKFFHPRCALAMTRSYQELDSDIRWRIDDLYHDYFYRRQEGFWQARGYDKLPVMRRASAMLLCGEDLGMVPHCVPEVLRELGILSLEIQRMPKRADRVFSDPADAPYLSVVSPSTHDMPTLRGWWREDPQVTADFAWRMMGEAFPPLELTAELATRIIRQHLTSPAMWAVFPLQDLLAMDEDLRHPDPDAERINVPADPDHRWRFRMHLTLGELAAADEFNRRLSNIIQAAGRGTGAPE